MSPEVLLANTELHPVETMRIVKRKYLYKKCKCKTKHPKLHYVKMLLNDMILFCCFIVKSMPTYTATPQKDEHSTCQTLHYITDYEWNNKNHSHAFVKIIHHPPPSILLYLYISFIYSKWSKLMFMWHTYVSLSVYILHVLDVAQYRHTVATRPGTKDNTLFCTMWEIKVACGLLMNTPPWL